MMLRSPHSVAEFSVSFLTQGSQHHPCSTPAARTFLIHKQQESKARPVCPQALSSLQQDVQPRETSQQGTQQSAQTQLELLEKLTSGTDKNTIAKQLVNKAVVNADDEVVVPLGKQIPMEYDDLTVSQKRNIRRQKYLDQVSKRNDAPFFATIALLVILPPAVILGVATATGYINFLP